MMALTKTRMRLCTFLDDPTLLQYNQEDDDDNTKAKLFPDYSGGYKCWPGDHEVVPTGYFLRYFEENFVLKGFLPPIILRQKHM